MQAFRFWQPLTVNKSHKKAYGMKRTDSPQQTAERLRSVKADLEVL